MNVSLFLGVMSLVAIGSASSPTADASVPASPWRAQTSPVTVELRGLAVVSTKVAWASGAKGTVLRTVDGETWKVLPVAGAEALDFRDIQAWDANAAIAMSIGPGAASNVYKTTDGGKSWRKVFANAEPTGFWDAITFWDRKNGALFGDPVRGRFQVYLTSDGGESWKAVADAGLPVALENEGAFAASGSCLVAGSNKRLAFVTGGAAESRVFVSMDGGTTFHVSSSPVPAAGAPKGLFSAVWLEGKSLLVVGGDYKEPTLEGVNAATSTDGGAHWTPLHAQPVGFLSSVVEGPDAKSPIVAVGLAGTGISSDNGASWTALDATPYNTAGFVRGGGFAVGPKGLIARWKN